MSQTEVNINQGIANEGLLADQGNRDVASFISIERIPFGRFVSRVLGSDTKCKLPTTSDEVTVSGKFGGVSVRDQARENINDGLLPGYNAEDAVSSLREGRIYVRVEQDVVKEDDVFIRFVPVLQVQELAKSGAFVASNVINGDINGVPIAPVAFDTDNDTTLANLAAAIEALGDPKVDSATDSAPDDVDIVSALDQVISITNFVVTGGASQAVFTVTETVEIRPTSSLGAFRKDADTATAANPGSMRYFTSALKDEFAIVELDV